MTEERLTHTHEAFVRRMQISPTRVFVFVEGESDQHFYSHLATAAYEGRWSFRLTSANILRGPKGKPGLVAFFGHLRRNKLLCHTFKTKQTVAVFCLDKDVDDLTGELIESDHVLYTEFHSLENYFYVYGDLPNALSAVAEVELAKCRDEFTSTTQTEWRKRAAESWRAWVELCLMIRLCGLDGPCNYSSPSQLHDANVYGDHSADKFDEFKDRIKAKTGLPEADFEFHLREIQQQVETIYLQGRHDSVFKGDWYTYFARQDAATWFGKSIDVRSLNKVLQVTLRMGEAWTAPKIEKLRRVAGCVPTI